MYHYKNAKIIIQRQKIVYRYSVLQVYYKIKNSFLTHLRVSLLSAREQLKQRKHLRR